MNGSGDAPAPVGSARLFIALWPGAAQQQALRAWCEPGLAGAGTKPVAQQQLHLTLHFLGAVPRERLPQLRSALRVPLQAFELGFSRCERWPGGLLVVVPDAVPPALAALHAALRDVLTGLGLRMEERALRPHITLARRHTGPLPPAPTETLRWEVSAYVLVESRSRPGGRYVILQTYP